jgi:putative oxidoreductase
MKITSIIARYLLGLIFMVFGLNGFLNFIHQPPPANPLAMQFFVAVSASHFAAFFFALQVLGGLLLLSGYFVPLALTLVAAELYNILAFHLTMAPATMAPALVASVLWVLVFLQYRESFKGILNWRRGLRLHPPEVFCDRLKIASSRRTAFRAGAHEPLRVVRHCALASHDTEWATSKFWPALTESPSPSALPADAWQLPRPCR